MRSICLLPFAAMFAALSIGQSAQAIPQFYTEYKKLYLDNHPDKDYAAAVNKGTAKCLVCHQGKNRKHHNAFGIHLVEPLDRKRDMRDKEKIQAELKKAVEMHVDPKDPKSETYLDRIKASKWPGGEFKDLEKESADEAAGK